MAPVRSFFLTMVTLCTALSTVTAGRSPPDLSSFNRSGVIPSEELSAVRAVEEGDSVEESISRQDSPSVIKDNVEAGHGIPNREFGTTRRQLHQRAQPEETVDSVLRRSPPNKPFAALGPSRPYVYDRSAKPLSPLAGNSPYPLYYTSYHLFAPSLVQNTRPGLEYFGDPPDSYDPLYYGKYQRLAEDVFEQKFVRLRNAGDRRGDLYAETHRQKRRRKGRAY